MNERDWLKRSGCILLVALLLLIFCAVGHDCHHEQCPVCLLSASFRMTMGLLILAFGWLFVQCRHVLVDAPCAATGIGASLVALKVKLSD